MQFATAMSRLASQEQDAARGSELHFKAGEFAPSIGVSTCTMRLASLEKVGPGGLPLFVADARFFKAAMRRVQAALLELDPQAQTSLAN